MITAIVNWCCGNTKSYDWPIEETKAKLRFATVKEIETHTKKNLKKCSVTWLLKGAWSLVVRTVNTVALLRGFDLRANKARSLNIDPFLSEHKIFLPVNGSYFYSSLVSDDPTVAQELLRYPRNSSSTKDPYFIHKGSVAFSKMIDKLFGGIGATDEDFMLTCSKEKNKEYRTFLHRYFNPAKVKENLSAIQEIVIKTVGRWGELEDLTAVNITEQAKLFACDVMSKLYLGYEGDPSDMKFAVDTFNKFLSSQWVKVKIPEGDVERAREIFIGAIESAMQSGKKSTLVKAMAEDEKFSDIQVKMMIFTLFFGGIDNTAASIAYALLKIAQDPKLQERIFSEYKEKIPTDPERFNPEMIVSLPLIRKVIAESMRMFTPAFQVDRLPKQDLVLEVSNTRTGEKVARYIDKAHRIHPQLTAVARNPKLYRNPQIFDPDRHDLEKVTSLIQQPFIPFGKGTHLCPGWKLFEAEKSLLIAQVVQQFILKAHSAEEPEQVGRFLNKLKKDVIVQVDKR